jgi:hypothetical protein
MFTIFEGCGLSNACSIACGAFFTKLKKLGFSGSISIAEAPCLAFSIKACCLSTTKWGRSVFEEMYEEVKNNIIKVA